MGESGFIVPGEVGALYGGAPSGGTLLTGFTVSEGSRVPSGGTLQTGFTVSEGAFVRGSVESGRGGGCGCAGKSTGGTAWACAGLAFAAGWILRGGR